MLWFWFGRFPAHTKLLFQSVAKNSDIDVLLFTDNYESAGKVPPNVYFHNTTLNALEARFQNVLLRTARLTFPYKICDYRPAFGEVFANELEPYDFWGWGDLDVIWGNLTEFLPAPALETCGKIFQFGALSFVRNNDEMNHLFRQGGGLDWMDVVQSEAFRGFDETQGIYAKIDKAGLRRHYDSSRADIIPYRPWFTERADNSAKKRLYSWINGQAYRESWCDKGLLQTPVSYVHFQKRDMPIVDPVMSSTECCFWITPNGFVDRPISPTRSEFDEACKVSGITYTRFAKYWMRRVYTRLRGTGVRKSVG